MAILVWRDGAEAVRTRVATASGAVALASLTVGDRIATECGGARPIVWLGRSLVHLERHPDPLAAAPLRIAADAFGPGQPLRPLSVSPDQILSLDGTLVRARLLLDGRRVTRELAGRRLRYLHVELDQSGVMFVDGLKLHSLSDGDRSLFANTPVPALHPCFDAEPVRADHLASDRRAEPERAAAPRVIARVWI